MRPSAPASILFGTMLLLAAGDARAGGRPYAFVQGTQAVSDGGLELENWFGDVRPRGGAPGDWEWWLGPVVGASDHVEVGLFGIFGQRAASSSSAGALSFDSLRLQATWQPVDRGRWPVDVRVRAELGLPVGGERITSGWLGAIAGKDVGRLDVTANAGGWEEWTQQDGRTRASSYVQGGLGASLAIARGLRAGGELFAWRKVDDAHDHEYVGGPSIAYGQGRFWTAATAGFGIDPGSPRNHARLVVGLLF